MKDPTELDHFENDLRRFVHASTRVDTLPPELARSLRTLTTDYRPESQGSWIFLGLFVVVLLGAYGAAVWSPYILAGMIVLTGVYIGLDRWLRHADGRTLRQAVEAILGRSRG